MNEYIIDRKVQQPRQSTSSSEISKRKSRQCKYLLDLVGNIS